MKILFKASLAVRGDKASRRVQVVQHKSGKCAITSFRGEEAYDRIESDSKRAMIQLAIQRVKEWEKVI